MILDEHFYKEKDVLKVAKALLGKVLYTKIDNVVCSGIITETEAYAGVNDKASHAFGNKLTGRTEVMYRNGGCAYIYLIYGMHSLFNVVTNLKGIPHAVLIRSIIPFEGMERMIKRLKGRNMDINAGNGPGKLSKLLGIDYKMSGMLLKVNKSGNSIWIEEKGIKITDSEIKSGKRIGIDYAAEDAELPYRFWLEPDGFGFFRKDY